MTTSQKKERIEDSRREPPTARATRALDHGGRKLAD